MIVYDDKTEGAIAAGKQLMLADVDTLDDVTFKASFIISSDLRCKGSLSALFDLIVLGDVEAEEADIKGRFVCLGKCDIVGSLTVQNDIWAEDIQATSITCHDRIVAQSIDADSVYSEGTIIIGKTLAIKNIAETNQDIICGETAFGEGRIVALRILTSDPLDLDEGTDALEKPYSYSSNYGVKRDSKFAKEVASYAQKNDYTSYLRKLSSIPGIDAVGKFDRYLSVLNSVDAAYPSAIDDFTDISVLLWLIDIIRSDYFKDWPTIVKWTEEIKKHFELMAEGKFSITRPGKPADNLLQGYTVSHVKYGQGIVDNISFFQSGSKSTKLATVRFNESGTKIFPIPDSLDYFLILSETQAPSSDEIRKSIICEIDSYAEWLSALSLINETRGYLGEELYSVIFELLIEKMGLKAKFVVDRFKEKGWD